jgi:hypothetical protein
MRTLTVACLVIALVLVFAPAAGAQVPTQDVVTGSGVDGSGFRISVEARSGPSGANPTGQVSVLSFDGTFVDGGEVTCLDVVTLPPGDPIGGLRARMNYRSQLFAGPQRVTASIDRFGKGIGLFGFVVTDPTVCSDGPVGPGQFFAPSLVIMDAAPDTAAPVLTVPSTITVKAQTLAGARVTYTATATDGVDPNPGVVCTPPSGSTFAIGTTTATCTATDATGNTAAKSFDVLVRLPASKDECTNGGWRSFGSVFKNQGDCVSFVATRGKNQPAGTG